MQSEFDNLTKELTEILQDKYVTKENTWKMLLINYYDGKTLPKSLDNAFICYSQFKSVKFKIPASQEKKDVLIKNGISQYKEEINKIFLSYLKSRA